MEEVSLLDMTQFKPFKDQQLRDPATGKRTLGEYDSATAAANALGLNNSQIGRCCNGQVADVMGHAFRWLQVYCSRNVNTSTCLPWPWGFHGFYRPCLRALLSMG